MTSDISNGGVKGSDTTKEITAMKKEIPGTVGAVAKILKAILLQPLQAV